MTEHIGTCIICVCCRQDPGRCCKFRTSLDERQSRRGCRAVGVAHRRLSSWLKVRCFELTGAVCTTATAAAAPCRNMIRRLRGAADARHSQRGKSYLATGLPPATAAAGVGGAACAARCSPTAVPAGGGIGFFGALGRRGSLPSAVPAENRQHGARRVSAACQEDCVGMSSPHADGQQQGFGDGAAASCRATARTPSFAEGGQRGAYGGVDAGPLGGPWGSHCLTMGTCSSRLLPVGGGVGSGQEPSGAPSADGGAGGVWLTLEPAGRC